MHIDRIYSLFFVIFYWICLLGCQEGEQKTTDGVVSPKQVHRGEAVTLSLLSTDGFPEDNLRVSLAPDNGISVGRFKHEETDTLSIPIAVDNKAALGPRILNVQSSNISVAVEIEVLESESHTNEAEDSAGGGPDSNEDEAQRLEIAPSVVARGELVNFVVAGRNTHFSSETTVSFGPDSGIAVSDIEVRSSTEISFKGEVELSASPGMKTLYLSGPTGQSVEVVSVDVEVLASITCFTDAYESNNDIGHAVPLNFPANINASICAGDHDYFKINVQEKVGVDYYLQFIQSNGDLDMELLTLQGQRISISESRTDNELITFTAPTGQSGERVLHIYGYSGAVNNYTITVNNSGISNCVDDAKEPNDYANAAVAISFPDSFSAMICRNDDDYYSVTIPAAMTVKFDTLFSHSSGDLNLALLSATNQVLAVSESADDNEQIVYTTSGPATFRIRVYAVNGDQAPYTLNVGEQVVDTDTGSDTGSETEDETEMESETGGDSESETETDVSPQCSGTGFTVEPASLSIGRYTARLTLKSDENPGWLSEDATVSLPDALDNVTLEGCTVTTLDQISCNITVGLFAEPGVVRVEVLDLHGHAWCGEVTIVSDGIAEAAVPFALLPDINRYSADIDVQAADRSDFFHIQPLMNDLLVFEAVSLDRENMDPILRLIHADGNRWAVYQDDETPLGIDSRFAYFFAAAGDWYVEVGPKFTDTFGDYKLYIYRVTHGRTLMETTSFNSTLEAAQMISPSMPFIVHGIISDQADVDVYQFAVARAAAVDVISRRLGPWDDSLADVDIAIYDASHTEIDHASAWYEAPTSEDPRIFLPEAGNYYLEVTPANKDRSDIDEKHTGFYAVNIREQLVINEVDNRVTSEDPFVEILGPPELSLDDYSITTYGKNGQALGSYSLMGIQTDAAGYAVVFNSSISGNTHLLDTGAGAAVLVYNNQAVDAVQFGTLDNGGSYAEGFPAPIGNRRTIGRGAGVDTNNNDLDFFHMANPTPGAPNDRTFLSPIPLYGESNDCSDRKKGDEETGMDCGGVCGPCPIGERCDGNVDCRSGLCSGGICADNDTCMDLELNQNETDVDCGGVCPGCPMGAACDIDSDCVTLNCEVGICGPPETCDDVKKNQDETDVDCGGTKCPKCVNGKVCLINGDCTSGFCKNGICANPETCTDIIKNQDETDVDCGGTKCPKCVNGKVCLINGDCTSGFCKNGICSAPETCTDGKKNQDETDIDCGGVCPKCADGKICTQDMNCLSDDCAMGRCVRITGTLTITGSGNPTYCASLKVKNNSQTGISNWSSSINTKGFYPYTVWNIAFSGSSSPYTVTPTQTWNRAIAGGATVEVGGWCANVTGTTWQPQVVWVKGE